MTRKRKILHAIVLSLEILCVLISLFGILVLGSYTNWDLSYIFLY